jgi:GAF domain-containing protein/methyl-accepting chemotaxis protein
MSMNNKATQLNNAPSRIGTWAQLSYSQKFTIITLIFALPLLAFAPLVYEQILRIDRYGLKEAEGTLYLRDLWKLTDGFQNYKTASTDIQIGKATQQDLESAKAQVDDNLQLLQNRNETAVALGLNFNANSLAAKWNTVKTPDDITPLLESVSTATREVGDRSYLILDPDLDTYYLMDAVLLKLPENQAILFKIRLLTTQATLNNGLSLSEETELQNYLSIISQNLEGIKRGLLVASRNNTNQAVSPTLQTEFQKYTDGLNAYLTTAQNSLDNNVSANEITQLNSLYSQAASSSTEFYLLISQGLERGIQNRTRSFSVRVVLYVSFSVISILIAFLIGNRLMKSISSPLQKTINAAEQFAVGNWTTRIDYASNDEAGRVIEAFNRLAVEIETNQNALKLRSDDLADRALKLETISRVAREITSIRNLPSVLSTATNLIFDNFGYYHIGIFLLDARKEYAVLVATNSEGGKKMLDRGHQLKIGETGIVGYVAESLQARIALDVGNDAVYFNNPDLPQTRSELAMPLVANGQILGVIDVQSTQSMAFKQEDITILQILAEQLAIAIQNANLFTEAENAVEASRLAYGEVSREAWSKILNNQPRIGFVATQPTTVETHGDDVEPSLTKAFDTGDLILGADGLTISVPIKIRGQAIGALRLKKSEISEAWTQEETNLAIALSDQLSGALESARLYRDSQQRAARESLVSDISTRISSVSHVDAILRETVQELGQALKNSSVTFQLLDQTDEQKPTEDSRGSANRPLER